VIVVSDATPVRYLILIEQIDVLPRLFGRVLVPPAVVAELSRAGTPPPVRDWVQTPPTWLEVRAPVQDDPGIRLGMGERQAICLARELKADLLLIDDRKARHLAEHEGLSVVGTLNILQAAAERGWLELVETIEKLRRTNFHVSERLLRHVLAEHARTSKGP
jgi:predicted nucleic acid-binding protein